MKRVVPIVLFLALATNALAWGEKGHSMTARIATRQLPADMPAFFRAADVELGYLCPEPDRWRNAQREPALRGLADRDHTVVLEHLTPPLPPNRYEYLLQFAGKPKFGGGTMGYRDLGYAPYAIAEYSEMLAVNFMLWRKAPAVTEEQRRIRRQIEQNIIHIAGLLGHFVTDTGQPLHTSIHVNGWSPSVPNPNGYAGPGIHRRFETDYVNAALEERDFQDLVAPVKPRSGPWLEEALRHIRDSNRHVERTYALDRAHPFGSGSETAEAKRFTAERLAFSAVALRDFWYSAWVRSATLPEQ
jgi:hypothetical protein